MTYSAVEYQNNSDLHFPEGQAHRSFLLYLLTMLASSERHQDCTLARLLIGLFPLWLLDFLSST